MPLSLRTSPLLTVVNVIVALLFAAFAWLQRNDIDPAIYHQASRMDAALWLVFYALIAVLFLLTIFFRIPRWLLVVALIACLVEMAVTFPGLRDNLFGGERFDMTGVSMSAEDPRIELTREFFGAFIAFLGVLGLLIQQRVRNVSPADRG